MADQTPREHVILWRRLDQPGHDIARLVHHDSSWQINGTAVFAHDRQPCRVDYVVVCDERWHTSRAEVTGSIGHRPIAVRIAVDAARGWRLNDAPCPDVAGCIDVDLSFSPCTNLLPIRRLGLVVGGAAPVRAAWLSFPACTIEPLEQLYRRTAATTYRYESAGGRFVAQLDVDTTGFVTRYGDLWEAEAGC